MDLYGKYFQKVFKNEVKTKQKPSVKITKECDP
jgi:hypothetical protein